MARTWCSTIVSAAITFLSSTAAIGATCESLGSDDIPYATITAVQSVPS